MLGRPLYSSWEKAFGVTTILEAVHYSLAIEVKGLRKTFTSGILKKRKKEVLKGIELLVPKGDFWCLLGPNGAGKTTLLSILSTLISADGGSARVLGVDIGSYPQQIRGRINISSGHANFLWSMSVRENLNYYAMLYGLTGRRRRERVDYLLSLFDLGNYARSRFDELSTGTKQRLSLAKSLVNKPELLFLDEPTVGLDPDVSRKIRAAIRNLHEQEGTTILMTTHNMKEAEAMCRQVAFIVDGAIRAVGKPDELKRDLKLGDTISVIFSGGSPAIESLPLEGIYGIQREESRIIIHVDDHRLRIAPLIAFLNSNGRTITGVEIHESDLEDVFLAFTR